MPERASRRVTSQWRDLFRIAINHVFTAALFGALVFSLAFIIALTGVRGRWRPLGSAFDFGESAEMALQAAFAAFAFYFVLLIVYKVVGGKNETWLLPDVAWIYVLRRLPMFAVSLMVCGLGLVGFGIWHFDDPPVDTVALHFNFPSKRQYTWIGFGVTLILMRLSYRAKE